MCAKGGAEMTQKFNVATDLTLCLENLWAEVTVRTGQPGVAEVTLEGEEKLLKQIKVTQPSPDQLSISGPENSGGGMTVISSGGSVSVRGGRGSVVIGGSVSGARIITGRNLVIVNGRVVSGGEDATVIEGDKIATITVTVPQGTHLDVSDVQKLDSRGLGGRLDLSLHSQGEARVQDVVKAKIACHGQSHCRIANCSGDLRVTCGGQSSATVSGTFGDVEADSSGQSHISVNGNCGNFDGSAGSQSTINFTGTASGKVRKHESGQSHVIA